MFLGQSCIEAAYIIRAVGRSENPGVAVLFGGHNLPPLVEIGLTDLPKFGGAMAPPEPPGTTGLHRTKIFQKRPDELWSFIVYLF